MFSLNKKLKICKNLKNPKKFKNFVVLSEKKR